MGENLTRVVPAYNATVVDRALLNARLATAYLAIVGFVVKSLHAAHVMQCISCCNAKRTTTWNKSTMR